MIESDDYLDPVHRIPVFSLYGKTRRLTPKMKESFDVLLFDLQDVGCRIYTFLTTLVYLLEDCAGDSGKEIWVLDRPNPAGRPVEGSLLKPEFETFVGAAPCPMRHGMTLGEMAQWYKAKKKLKVNLTVVPMVDYHLNEAPGWGWPLYKIPWVNPSPNIPRLSSTRTFSGTVLIEGTNLSEARGTTRPLEIIGAPDIEADKILKKMMDLAPTWFQGVLARPTYFEPTFQKHMGRLCSGLQFHVDFEGYDHDQFKPYRLVALFLKALRALAPSYDIWRKPPYEYEDKIMPFDMLSGSSMLREWVDDRNQGPRDLDQRLRAEELAWVEERKPFLLY